MGSIGSALIRGVPPLVALVGVTATGKSALGLALAAALDGEIVNADALQVYRGFDLGTAKPTREERARV
ncbi:MAG TPA: isopentenyl transferase family protein, partial [Thermoanaerobaculia bacterium]|nr:isopentenyl transferase family protein [Thermoanaerobaculia bacterium]